MTTVSSPVARVLAVLLSAVLGVTVAQVPASAAKPDPFKPAAAKKVPAVPVTAVKPGKAPTVAAFPDASKQPAPMWPAAGQAETAVPRPPTGSRGAAGRQARVGGTPVSIRQPAGSADTPNRVRVQVLDRAATAKAGVRGVLLKVGRADAVAKPGPVDVAIDYKPFRTAYGADWASRLRLVALPECALTMPESRDCAGTPLQSTNDTVAGTVSAKVSVTTAGTLLAVQAAASGPAGDYAATSLQASSTWAAGGNSGDFTWSYPMRVPPAPGGPAPKVGLAYSSQSVDGRHAASNNQPSWVGEGFEAWPGYIERAYEFCGDDMQGGANNNEKTGDQCWATDNATLSLSGHSGELIYNASEQRWHLRSDDGTRVERKTNAENGDDNGEYWVVTTNDGVQYWFGLNKLPGAGSERTDSAWTAPVFGNHSGEPCHATAFADSSCAQAYRWNLDYVVDTHGNSASYWYAKETNKYARNLEKNTLAEYVRGGYLRHVAYGTRRDNDADTVFGASAPARVVFDTEDRCLSSCGTHDGVHWPDVPWDQQCTAAPCETYSPTFWSTQRLSTVTTQVLSGTSYRDVERWTLTHTFPDPGDTTRAGLWLAKISHTGLIGTATSVPDIEFTPVQLANRVDPEILQDHSPAMKWMRIAMIRHEAGGTTSLTYSQPDCVPGSRMPSAPHANALRCYPVVWTPEGYTNPITDYFHKYLVSTIHEIDHTGGAPPKGSPPITHTYSYLGSPAWHYADDDGLIEKKEKTWSVWRGYERVGVTTGDGGDRTYTETKYFRGMHGDKQPTGTRSVPVTGTGVPTVNDEDAYAGTVREVIVHNGPRGPVVSREVNEPWQSAATASRTINGDIVEARFTDVQARHERVALDAGRDDRVRTLRSTFDAYGMVVAVDDTGDTNVTGDEQCARTTFEPRNGTAWILNRPHRRQVLALPCAQTNDPASLTGADIVSDGRAWFDGSTSWGTAPTRGLTTRNEKLSAWNAGTPTYVTVARASYDTHGRVVSQWDAMDKATTTAYTPAKNGVVTQTVVTNPLSYATTTTLEPAWGAPTATVDPNGKRTVQGYDGLGRLTGVWLPGRAPDTHAPNVSYTYQMRADAVTLVTTTTLNAQGDPVTTYALFDGLLRPRQTQSASPVGGRLLTETFYDTANRKVLEYGAYHDPTGTAGSTLVTSRDALHVPNQTQTVYDGAGRATASVFSPYGVERWRTRTYYAGDRTDLTPPAGATATSTITDIQGRARALRQYRGTTPTGAHVETSYTYDRKGQLSRVTDAAGNHWDFGYDLRGRQVEASDPDKGTTISGFDNADRLTSTTDSRGVKLVYQYDAMGRKTALFENQLSATPRARWLYDGILKGQLSETIRYVNGATYRVKVVGYTDTYQPTGHQVIIPTAEIGLNDTYENFYAYRVDGSFEAFGFGQTADLESESLNHHYDEALGLPNRLTTTYGAGESSYVADTDYDALGQVDQFDFHTGLYEDEDGGEHVFQTFTREFETGRLTGVKTERELLSPYTLADVQYNYDDAGNVTKIADLAAAGGVDNQCMRYDFLRRLSEAWTPANGDCAAPPAAAALGGPARYWLKWTHDDVGNRLTQDEYTPSGNRSTAYAYPAAGGPQPHTVTGTTTTIGTTTTAATYDYDNTGNTEARPTAASGTQALTWDAEGRLEKSVDSTGTTTYIYDADGNRLIRRDPAGKTLFLPGQEVRFTNATAARTCTRYYTFGGHTFASRTAAGFTWLTSDHQGTAQVRIDPTTQQAAVRRQTPYGTPRGTVPAWPNTKGFVGGTVDNTGLTHLGAREYDPSMGRFISVDPIVDFQDPQQIHGYSYGNNNPVTLSDPDGLRPPEIDPGDWADHEAENRRKNEKIEIVYPKDQKGYGVVKVGGKERHRISLTDYKVPPENIEIRDSKNGTAKGQNNGWILANAPADGTIFVANDEHWNEGKGGYRPDMLKITYRNGEIVEVKTVDLYEPSTTKVSTIVGKMEEKALQADEIVVRFKSEISSDTLSQVKAQSDHLDFDSRQFIGKISGVDTDLTIMRPASPPAGAGPPEGPRGTGPRGGGGKSGPRGGGAAGKAGTGLGIFGFFSDLYFFGRYGPCGTGYLPEEQCSQGGVPMA
ncbi:RHS repeat-associated core domain-containing protein [Micromonospora sp. CPCC 206061]|uniref:RHS repeat-associated core domain-containing protein n=1 Tax=Micromonospora sp. CPCC 206061 TaxID=3122410 RepID=UPI002FF39C59